MRLHTILQDRTCINILKVMHINEYIEKKSHTMTYTQLRQVLGMANGIASLRNLACSGLIAKEAIHEELVLSMTAKGRKFIEHFDQLVDVYTGAHQDVPAFKIQYELTETEKRIILCCYTIKTEHGGEIPLSELAKQVYSLKKPEKSKGTLSKNIKRLEELNLIKKEVRGKQAFLDTTPSGERVAKEQILQEKTNSPVGAGNNV